MATASAAIPDRKPELLGQTVVLIGGSAGMALTGATYDIDGGQQLVPA